MRVPFFPLARLHADRREALAGAMLEVLDSGWFVLGPQVERFERDFAAYCGLPHCIGVGNGSDALVLALRALGVGPGDRVATVANAAAYSSVAIHACGAEPLFVDIEPERLLMSLASVEQALAQRPKVLVATHLYGQLCAIEAIAERCRAAGVALIEDCAQAHGARRGGRLAGAFGDIGCYSFYPTKNLGALGDGGALVTADAALARRLRALRQYGWTDKYRIEHPGGCNSRLDELQAAVLNAELPLLDGRNARRRAIAARYLAEIAHPAIAPIARGGQDDVFHLFVLRCAHRDALRAHLTEHGVQTDIHYPLPDHRQPGLQDAGAMPALPETERACAEVLSLPCHPVLTDAEIAHVIAACNAFPT
ncbi:MAG: DegT/DnrJ/EryC1/StrS family aminotransferase [Aquimonas sp.]|nr:DegT/DnrJ/EryC1/StrS family aminotransferase [Aquimonas sp.]